MSHNSGNVGQGPPSPSKDEVSTALLGCKQKKKFEVPQGLLILESFAVGDDETKIRITFNKLLQKCCSSHWGENSSVVHCGLKCHLQGDGISPLVQTSVLGKGVKHRPPPIKLPLGSGSSSSGTAPTSDKDEGGGLHDF